MTKTAERHEFQAEVKQLLDLLVHSLYSHKDIFLRELISNASDALDKVRFEALTNPDLLPGEELHIRLEADPKARTLSVSDNGIGMSRDELAQNLGTIARSGTTDFVEAVRESKEQELSLDLIGQFGVGFYSSFMVADKVTVVTRRAGEDAAHKWESTGEGAYTLEDAERSSNGTTVTLHLRPVDEEDGVQDYTAEWVLKNIVKHHSDFVAYPIKMEVEREEGGEEGKPPTRVTKDETLNSMKAIWSRPKDEVSDEEFNEFYKHITHDWSDPLRHLSVTMEGAVEARALLYIPSKAPFDLYHREMSFRGLQLFIKRVFIMDRCEDLMPSHLRFIKGVVDSEDLSLNVSREILQQDRKIAAIRKFLVKKVMEELARLQKSDAKAYRDFWTQFGPVLKEGLLSEEKKDPILDQMLCHTTRDDAEVTTLDEYVTRLTESQDAIYYLTSPTLDAARRSPQLEVFLEKGYEVLLFTDPVDEIWLQNPPDYKGKRWISVGRGTVDLGTSDERKSAEDALKSETKDYEGLTALFRELLEDDIKEVRITNRLTSSPACLVGEVHDLPPQMIEVLRQAGQDVPKVKRILELNPKHAIVRKLLERFQQDKHDAVVRDYADLIYGQALLAEGSQPTNPAAFSARLAEVMEKGL
jgi:molecular chaperone HtpG